MIKKLLLISAVALIGYFAWRALSIGLSLSTEALEALQIQLIAFCAAIVSIYLYLRGLMRKRKTNIEQSPS